jgi:hypothetical protein
MRTHQQIAERSLAMARAIVVKIDRDPVRLLAVRKNLPGTNMLRDSPWELRVDTSTIFQ